ncbi:MAG: hypothetical protein ACTSUE_05140 [Promethearchaeota archaeon]
MSEAEAEAEAEAKETETQEKINKMHTKVLNLVKQLASEKYVQDEDIVDYVHPSFSSLKNLISDTIDYLVEICPKTTKDLSAWCFAVNKSSLISQTYKKYVATCVVLYKYFVHLIPNTPTNTRVMDLLFIVSAYLNVFCNWNRWNGMEESNLTLSDAKKRAKRDRVKFRVPPIKKSKDDLKSLFVPVGFSFPEPFMNMSVGQTISTLEMLTWKIYGTITPESKERRDMKYLEDLNTTLELVRCRVHMLMISDYDEATMDIERFVYDVKEDKDFEKNLNTNKQNMGYDDLLSDFEEDNNAKSASIAVSTTVGSRTPTPNTQEEKEKEEEFGLEEKDPHSREVDISLHNNPSAMITTTNEFDSDTDDDMEMEAAKLEEEQRRKREIKRKKTSNTIGEVDDYQLMEGGSRKAVNMDFVYDTNTYISYMEREIRACRKLFPQLQTVRRPKGFLDPFMFRTYLRKEVRVGKEETLVDRYHHYTHCRKCTPADLDVYRRTYPHSKNPMVKVVLGRKHENLRDADSVAMTRDTLFRVDRRRATDFAFHFVSSQQAVDNLSMEERVVLQNQKWHDRPLLRNGPKIFYCRVFNRWCVVFDWDNEVITEWPYFTLAFIYMRYEMKKRGMPDYIFKETPSGELINQKVDISLYDKYIFANSESTIEEVQKDTRTEDLMKQEIAQMEVEFEQENENEENDEEEEMDVEL